MGVENQLAIEFTTAIQFDATEDVGLFTSRLEEDPAVKNTITFPRKASVRRSSFGRSVGRRAAVNNEPAITPSAAPAIGDTLGILEDRIQHAQATYVFLSQGFQGFSTLNETR